MKRAMLIGIDLYDNFNRLAGCENDVIALRPLMETNEDDSPNFTCRTLTTATGYVGRLQLLEAIDVTMAPGADIAVFYFAGHGVAKPNDVVLASQDGTWTDPGLALSAVLAKVQDSPVAEVIIVLDCCFSGGAGGVPQLGSAAAVLRRGLSILTASRADQPAAETARQRGAFSVHLCAALAGGAADVLGRVTLAGLYSYLTEAFGAFEQRPTFKANLDRLHSLRVCMPPVPFPELRRLTKLFPSPDYEFKLDPSYEPTVEPHDPDHEAEFAVLQRYRSAKLLVPVGTDHMYFAAMKNLACRLTPLGKHYWLLAEEGRIGAAL